MYLLKFKLIIHFYDIKILFLKLNLSIVVVIVIVVCNKLIIMS